MEIFTHLEPENDKSGVKLNWLRAAVLGANDGIVSVASIVVGVAGASNSTHFIVTAGVAGLFAGALSMGVGEYVSVSAQKDAELVMGVHHHHLTNPWHAAWASTVSFICGGIVPLFLIYAGPIEFRVMLTFVGVLIALIITGGLSAYAGGANKTKAIVRVVTGGILAMLITFGVGKIFGVVGI